MFDVKIICTEKNNYYAKFSVKNPKNIGTFVDDLNSVVHGSVEGLQRATLEKYDVITLNLLKIMSRFMELK